MRGAALSLALSALVAGPAPAPMPRERLDCVVLRECDAFGLCSATGERVVFEILARDGYGDDGHDGHGAMAQIDYGGTSVEAAREGPGRWVWAEGAGERHTLTLGAGSAAIWQRLSEPPGSTGWTRHLACDGAAPW